MRKFLVLCLALLLPLAACGDDDDPIGPERIGSLSFNYSGDISGTFSVSGEPKLSSNGLPQNGFAVAGTDDGDVFVGGFRPQQGSKFDFLRIELEGVTGPRTVTVCPQPTGTCPLVALYLGFNPNGDTSDRRYVLTSGSVTVSELSVERVRGSFQGSGILINPTTGMPDFSRTITISNGQFDAPIRNDFDFED